MHPGLIVAFTLLAWLIWFGLRSWERLVRIRRRELDGYRVAARPDATPDAPLALPVDAAWFAVRATDAEAVARVLRLRTVLPCNWAEGVGAGARDGTFVTPAVAGWVLVVGRDVADVTTDNAALERLLVALSDEFEVAGWFEVQSAAQRFGWAFAHRGQLVRGYAFDDERGHVYWQGDVTDDEHRLGCFVDDPRDRSDDEIKWWPDRATVLALASRWTIDPRTLADHAPASGVGLSGRL